MGLELRWDGPTEHIGDVTYTPINHVSVSVLPRQEEVPGIYVSVESKYKWDDGSYGLIFHKEDIPYLDQLISALVEARAELEGRL